MELIDVDIVRTEIIQGGLKIPPEILRRPGCGLGRDIDLIPGDVRKSFAHFFFAVGISPCGVKITDASLIGHAKELYGFFPGDPLDGQGAESVLGNGNTGTAKCDLFHAVPLSCSLLMPGAVRCFCVSDQIIAYPVLL